MLKQVERDTENCFKWEIPNHDKIFEMNLISSMVGCIKTDLKNPKDAYKWIYCILNGYEFKKDITKKMKSEIGLKKITLIS